MTITVNGLGKDLAADKTTIVDLLVLEQVTSPDMVSVQLNGDILKRAEFDTTELSDGDTVEFLYFMGGGSYYGA